MNYIKCYYKELAVTAVLLVISSFPCSCTGFFPTINYFKKVDSTRSPKLFNQLWEQIKLLN